MILEWLCRECGCIGVIEYQPTHSLPERADDVLELARNHVAVTGHAVTYSKERYYTIAAAWHEYAVSHAPH